MSRPLEEMPVLEAIESVVASIKALARHPGLTKIDAKAVEGAIGPFNFLKIKHDTPPADGRMLATPTGDREDASCRA